MPFEFYFLAVNSFNIFYKWREYLLVWISVGERGCREEGGGGKQIEFKLFIDPLLLWCRWNGDEMATFVLNCSEDIRTHSL